MRERPAPEADVRDLVRRARDGDEQAFSRLVETHMRAVYAVAYRMMGDHDAADDVAQETFVRAYRALGRYDPTYSFYTWLRTIATRVALHELAKRRRRRTEGGESFEMAAETLPTTAPDPQSLAEADELGSRVWRALALLPEEYRAVIVLRSQEQLSYAEIARTLDIPVGTVMSRLARGRERLRAALGLERDATGREREGGT
jgi:RNA polymerase sigma-70 factor (ECF subfamily)